MSYCLSLFILPRLTIYRAVRLTTAICHAMSKRFLSVSRRFERSQSHHLLGQSIRKVQITRAEILSLSAVRALNSLSLSLSLSLTSGLKHPQSCSAPRHIGCSATNYTAHSDTSLFPTQKPPVLYNANSVSIKSHRSSAGRKMCE
jgi:hypothetical protein